MAVASEPLWDNHHMRNEWVKQRTNDKIRTQMHYARKGMITGEMAVCRTQRKSVPGTDTAPRLRAD